MKRRNPWLKTLFWIVVSFVTLFPIYWLFVISVKPAVDLFSTPSIILTDVYWQNYIDVWNDETLRGYMVNSLIISSGNALLCTTLGFFACYALTRFNIGGKESIFFWTITNRMAPPAVFLLPLFLLMTQVYRFGNFSLLDTRIGMILVYCTFNLPFAIWTLRPTLDGIPRELDEAASIDGCGPFRIYWKIILPLMLPALATTAVFTFIWTWNDFLTPLIYLTDPEKYTVPLALATFQSKLGGTNWGPLLAMSTLSLVPVLIAFFVGQRYLVRGISTTGLK